MVEDRTNRDCVVPNHGHAGWQRGLCTQVPESSFQLRDHRTPTCENPIRPWRLAPHPNKPLVTRGKRELFSPTQVSLEGSSRTCQASHDRPAVQCTCSRALVPGSEIRITGHLIAWAATKTILETYGVRVLGSCQVAWISYVQRRPALM